MLGVVVSGHIFAYVVAVASEVSSVRVFSGRHPRFRYVIVDSALVAPMSRDVKIAAFISVRLKIRSQLETRIR